MGRDVGMDEAVEHFTLDSDERELLRNKAGGRLGFAVMLKYLQWRGRFPRGRHEIPDDAIAHVARQIGASAGDMGFYDLTNRQASNHRAEIRRYTGFRVCTVADADKLALWLAAGIARDGGSGDYVQAELLRHCRAERIEPPTTDRVKRIVESGIRQADEALVDLVVCRLSMEHIARIEALVGVDVVNAQDPDLDAGDEGDADDDEPDLDVLASIKTDPGNVSLASMLTEIAKLEAARAIGLPTTLFTDISPKVVAAWRARAAVESPSHLRRHARPVRLVLLAALLYQRQREITDALVELLNSCIHKINAHAEKTVTEEFVRQYKRIRNKDAMLHRVAEVSLESPEEPVREVIYPVMGGEAGLTDLLREYRARSSYERDKRRVFKSSYTNHYRIGLIKLLQVLEVIRQDAEMPTTRFCTLLGIPRRSYARWQARVRGDGWQAPVKGPWPAPVVDLLEPVAVKYAADWPGWGHRKIYGLLRADGHTASCSSVQRALRRRGLLQPVDYTGARRELAKARRAAFAQPPSGPNQVRQLDFSEYETGGGGTWRLAGCCDYFSKYEYGWHLAPGCTGADAIAAVQVAIEEAERLAGGSSLLEQVTDQTTGQVRPIKLVTDNGGAFQGHAFAAFLASRPELRHIRTRRHSPGQNGVRERAFGSLKYEHLYRLEIPDLPSLAREAEAYRQIFYNGRRRHSSCGMKSPIDYETAAGQAA